MKTEPTDKKAEDVLKSLLDAPLLEEDTEAVVKEITDASENDDAAKMMGEILRQGMMSPEEIEKAAKRAEHNAEIQRRREEDLAKRKARRAVRPKMSKGLKKNRRRLG
jgi:hypothetical protein